MNSPKLIIIGGFLGAGKTTLLANVSKKLRGQGLKTGLVTNDQAPELVDTAWLGGADANVREVSGSCFCCNFNGFAEALKILAERGTDVILAEPVGSCTDLSATILQPLKALHGNEYDLAPFTVLLDPVRAREVLGRAKSTLHADAFYILRLQLAEADRILLNKADLLSPEEARELARALGREFPDARVTAISSKAGDGVGEWLEWVVSPDAGKSGKAIVEVDYDRYANGEAVLGWLNLSARPVWRGNVDPRIYLAELLFNLRRKVNDKGHEVGHVKVLLPMEDGLYIANWIDNRQEAEVRRTDWESPRRDDMLLFNARVECEPEVLEEIVRKTLAETGRERVEMSIVDCHCLKPGRPNPTHRYVDVM